MQNPLPHQSSRVPWNKGKLIGQKPPFKLNEIWAIRVRLQIARRIRDLALFNLAIDSKLRACDLVGYESGMSHMAARWLLGRSSCSERPSGRSV